MTKMSIHRALAELKLLDKKIAKAITSAPKFCVSKKKDAKLIGKDTPEQYKNKVQSSYDSIMELIKRREKIKAAIMYSNAITKVKINGEEMSVAEAIERKKVIEYKKRLLEKMKEDLIFTQTEIDTYNASLDSKLERFLQASLGDNPSPEDIDKVSKIFLENNKVELYDPINLENKIEKLEKEIDDFLMEIDFVLSESNSTTFIDLD